MRLRLLLAARTPVVRRVFATLALIGCVVGLLRAAFPAVAHHHGRATARGSVDAFVNVAAGDSSSSIEQGRPVRTGARRSVIVLAALPRDLDDRPRVVGLRRVIASGEPLAHASVDPLRPFHPPRVI